MTTRRYILQLFFVDYGLSWCMYSYKLYHITSLHPQPPQTHPISNLGTPRQPGRSKPIKRTGLLISFPNTILLTRIPKSRILALVQNAAAQTRTVTQVAVDGVAGRRSRRVVRVHGIAAVRDVVPRQRGGGEGQGCG